MSGLARKPHDQLDHDRPAHDRRNEPEARPLSSSAPQGTPAVLVRDCGFFTARSPAVAAHAGKGPRAGLSDAAVTTDWPSNPSRRSVLQTIRRQPWAECLRNDIGAGMRDEPSHSDGQRDYLFVRSALRRGKRADRAWEGDAGQSLWAQTFVRCLGAAVHTRRATPCQAARH